MAKKSPRPGVQKQPARSTKQPLEPFLLRGLLHAVPDIVYFKDRQFRFIAVSKPKAARHGFANPDALVGKSDEDFFAEQHARQTRADEEEIIRTGMPVVGKLEKLTWPDGHESWALTNKFPLEGPNGEIFGTFGLSKDVTEAKRMETALNKANAELVEASRFASMAEVATGILHNVGNVLTNVNLSTEVLLEGLRHFEVSGLDRLGALLHEHRTDFAAFLASHPEGQRVPDHLAAFASHLAKERSRLLKVGTSLQQCVDHINNIIRIQQNYAVMAGVIEPLSPSELIEDSLTISTAALVRHEVKVVREFQPTPPVMVDKHRVLQILVNLIRNSKYALDEVTRPDKHITLKIAHDGGDYVSIIVTDNGVGIPRGNLAKMFTHGFTTRKEGHGFGLHSSLLAAQVMGGLLSAYSDGSGHGATFTLMLRAVKSPAPAAGAT
jgi:PAS domain S-box-containing protein